MRPRPLSTQAYLRKVSTALRTSERLEYDWSWAKYTLGLIGLALLIASLFWLVAALPKADMHDRQLLDPGAETRIVGHVYHEKLPGGPTVKVRYRGRYDVTEPPAERQIGDEFSYFGGHWIWLVVDGKPQWVDP